MARKDKPMVTPTAQSIREKIGTIPSRMTMRFAEEAKNEMNRIKSGKASSYETERMSKKDANLKDFSNLAKDDAQTAMKKAKATLDKSMRDEATKIQATESSRLRAVGTQLKMEEAKKKK
jgi:ketol-acid reductoisomerase